MERVNEGEGSEQRDAQTGLELAATAIGPGREAEIRNGEVSARIRNRAECVGKFGCDPDGVPVFLGVSHSEEQPLQPKGLANDFTNLLVKSPVENMTLEGPPVTTGVVKCDPKLEELREAITPICIERVHKAPDEEVLKCTLKELGDATAEDLIAQIRRKGASFKSLALLPHLARDARQVAEARAKRATPRQDAVQAPPFEREQENSDSVWSRICAAVRPRVKPIPYENWFVATRFESFELGVLAVHVPFEDAREILEQEYGGLIEAAAAELGLKVKAFKWIVAEGRQLAQAVAMAGQ